METDTVVVIATPWLTLILGAIIPFLTGLITKKMASSALKSVCTAVLSTAAGIFSAAQLEGSFHLEQAIVNVLVAFITAISLYYGFYRPTHAAEAVQNVAPNLGVG